MEFDLMGLEVNAGKPLFGGVQSNFFINPIQDRNIGYRPSYLQDTRLDSCDFSTDVKRYTSREAVIKMINSNPQIIKILKNNAIPVQINMNTLNDLVKNHMTTTKDVVGGIVKNLPEEFQQNVDLISLQKASALHDIGKVLIPSRLLNKVGKLIPEEANIVHLHANLGYELLKTTDLDDKTLQLIRYHHQNAQKTGYPKVDDTFVSDINMQILNSADMYSALIEPRPYKNSLSKNQALSIIHREMKQGKIHPYVFKALVDFANKQEETLNDVDANRESVDMKSVNRLCA